MHWSAATTLAHGRSAGLITDADDGSDQTLARTAAAAALARHVGHSESTYVGRRRTVRVVGPDLRAVGLLIGSGGCSAPTPRRVGRC